MKNTNNYFIGILILALGTCPSMIPVPGEVTIEEPAHTAVLADVEKQAQEVRRNRWLNRVDTRTFTHGPDQARQKALQEFYKRKLGYVDSDMNQKAPIHVRPKRVEVTDSVTYIEPEKKPKPTAWQIWWESDKIDSENYQKTPKPKLRTPEELQIRKIPEQLEPLEEKQIPEYDYSRDARYIIDPATGIVSKKSLATRLADRERLNDEARKLWQFQQEKEQNMTEADLGHLWDQSRLDGKQAVIRMRERMHEDMQAQALQRKLNAQRGGIMRVIKKPSAPKSIWTTPQQNA